MKKTIYSILAVAAGVILASGCSKDINPVENNPTGEITLTASLPGDLTKAAVDGTDNTQVNWSAGDAISVWGGENNQFTLSSEAGTPSGSFSGTVTSGTAQYAMYPYSATATADDYGIITTNVPNTQTVPENSFDPAAAIVVGTISESTITFRHVLSYLKITAPSDVTNLVEITIESNGGVQLTGDAKFSATYGNFLATGTPCKYVTIRPSAGVFTSGGIYYAAVIPGTYTGGLTVRYLYSDASAHTLTEKTKSSSTELALTTAGTAKLLGAATTFDHIYEAVQLWEDGPYWATTNIGADASTDYGQYFAWGYTTAYSWTGSAWSPSITFDSTGFPDYKTHTYSDMAAANWGTGWSVPTENDFDNLRSNCTASYATSVNIGVTFTGKGGYTSNSIFLSAAGYGFGSRLDGAEDSGRYWSSVQDDSIYAYYLYFTPGSGYLDAGCGYKSYGYSVRPVRSYTAPTPTPSVLLSGEFSVSGTKKVKFTRGNLYWDGSASAWGLETSQTDYPTTWSTSHVGHFYWTKTAAASYAASYDDGDCTTEDKFFADGSDADHSLTIDGQSGLYALTGGDSGEWNYLFNNRDNASDLYNYGVSVTTSAGTVANCVVIAPDACLGGYTFDNTKTSYTAAEWAAAEAGGLVCLPAAGYRENSGLSDGGSTGHYWSATPHEDEEDAACRLYFENSDFDPSGSYRRDYGSSVRLVCSVSK